MIIPDDLHLNQYEEFMPNTFSFNTSVITRLDDPSTATDYNNQSEKINNTSTISSSIQKDENPSTSLNSKRKFFTKQEDHLLTIAAINYNQESWNSIAQCVPGRTPKQCRDRWVNYLKPSLKFDPWSENEDQMLVSLVNTYGTHWTKMKNQFPNRSSNSLKNRWYWLIKNQVHIIPVGKTVISPIGSNLQVNFKSDEDGNTFNKKCYYYLSNNRTKRKNLQKIPMEIPNNIQKEPEKKKKKKNLIQNNGQSSLKFDEDLISFLPEELNW